MDSLESTESPTSRPPEADSRPFEESRGELEVLEEKLAGGNALTQQEKVRLKKLRRVPVTLPELEEAKDALLKRICKQVHSLPAKEIPKAMELISGAINERRAGGEKIGAAESRQPTREEMLAALQGRSPVKAVNDRA